MVETTSTSNKITNVAAEDHIRFARAADVWWGNMLAVIKLRQKGATKVSMLPNGVFRYMLEYKFPNELLYRLSDPYKPIKNH